MLVSVEFPAIGIKFPYDMIEGVLNPDSITPKFSLFYDLLYNFGQI